MIKKTLIFCLLLAGCSERYVVYRKSEVRDYWLNRVEKPKNKQLYLSLEDAETGMRYDSILVTGKHDTTDLEVGKLYPLRRNYWSEQGREFSDFDGGSIEALVDGKIKKNNFTR